MPQQTTHQNKELVTAFYRTAFVDGRPQEAASQYLGNYKQHNPTVPDGAEGFVKFVREFKNQYPQAKLDIKRVFEDGGHVIIHSHLRTAPNDRGMAVVDIFRVQDGKIVEHWDVLQPVPEKAANGNTMF